MEKKYLPLEKAKKLEEVIGFLSHYKPVEGFVDHIGPSIEEVDEKYSQLLKRLGELNVERDEILEQFKK